MRVLQLFKKKHIFFISLSSSCLFSCLASSLFLSSLFSSLDLLFSCLVFTLLVLSCLSFFVSLSLSLSVSVCLCLCLCLCLSLSLSPCGVVCCGVVWCVSLLVVVCVCVCCGTLKKREKTVCGFKNASVCAFNQNVPVYADTTRTCVSTCARGAGTHGDVLNLHTEGVLYIHTGEQEVIVSSAYQNLPTYGYHEIQGFTGTLRRESVVTVSVCLLPPEKDTHTHTHTHMYMFLCKCKCKCKCMCTCVKVSVYAHMYMFMTFHNGFMLFWQHLL